MRHRDLNAIIARVMRYTVNMSVERITWQKAPAILGVLAWGDSEAIAVVQGWMDRAIEMQTSEGCLNYSDVEEYGAGHALTLTPTAGLIASLGYPLLSFYERTNDERYLSGLPPHQVSAMRRRLHQHPRAMLGDYYRLAFSGDGERAPQDLLAAPPTHALEFLKLAFDTLITHDFQELLPDLAVRSLIVQGDSDRLTPVWQAQLLRRLIGDAELWLCRGGGHLPFVTRYAHLNRRISRFLDDAGGEAPPAVMPAR